MESQPIENATEEASLGIPVVIEKPAPPALTPRQEQICGLLADGLTDKEIGLELGISEHTVNFHLRDIYLRLGVHSRLGAYIKFTTLPARVARENGPARVILSADV